MGEPLDVVIIGAGVIGAATAFELAKRDYRTLNVDKLPSSSYGPTANSCAIVRAHYSTEHGVRMAYAGLRYWQHWSEYLGAPASNGHLARYVQCGTLLLKSQLGQDQKVLPLYETVGVRYEEWDRATIARRLPILDIREFWPPTRPSDSSFWTDPPGLLAGGSLRPNRATSVIRRLLRRISRRRPRRSAPALRSAGRCVTSARSGGACAASPWRTAKRSTRAWWSTWPGRSRSLSIGWRTSRTG